MLDEKFILEQISFNTIHHDFILLLRHVSTFRIQHFVQYRKFRMLDEMLDVFKSAFTYW